MSTQPDEVDVDIRFVDVDADRVRVRTALRGSGPPVLLITGLGAGIELGAAFERQLALRGRQTISFDAPGVGQSTPYAWPRRMPGLARTVSAMLDELGYDRVDVLGASLGGVIAQQFAHQYPQKVRRLVLAATGPGLGGVPGSPCALLRLATPRRYRNPEHHRRIAGVIYGGAARRRADTLLHARGAPTMRPPSLAGYLGQLYAIAGWTSVPWLHKLPHKTLVLAGDDDPIVPVVNARILARRIPHAKLQVIKGGGHLFLLEAPATLARLVDDFLRLGD
jgi:poly(3-hydroxyoctanoate) depolymerase